MPLNVSNISVNTAEALVPTAYSLESATLKNHSGRELELKAFITDFSITESVYRPSLLLSMNVKDNINMMEEFQLTGQEKISIVLSRKAIGVMEVHTVNLDFIVTEYPIFGRFNNRLQVYSLRGVSPHAYRSELKKISRAYSGTIQGFVKEVLIDDLGVDSKNLQISNSSTALVKFIVPNMAPLDAIHWAMRRAYDSSGSPFYFYEKFDGTIVFESQSDMIARQSYREYEDAKFWTYGHHMPKEDFEERARRILSMASDVRMSKYVSIPNGAYSSRTDYLDLSTKTLTRSTFKYDSDFNSMKWMDKNKVISKDFKPDNPKDTLSDHTDSLINYISTNKLAFENGQNYHAPTAEAHLNRAQSYVENMDNISHDISLAGDFKLTVGTMITLKLPPAVDPEAKLKNSSANNNLQKDHYFSGRYIVFSVVHNFADKYTMDVKAKRDTLVFELK